MKPTCVPSCWFATAISPAHKGATALVPPITLVSPSTRIVYPVVGSASPVTSGTPRPPPLTLGAGTFELACQLGRGNRLLTPPPVAPSLLAVSFHTTSETIVAPLAFSFVPPHASTCGLDAGKSTLFPVAPSLDPSSPAATVIVMPSAAALWHAASSAVAAWCVQVDSGPPQLIEITLGLFVVSWTAVVIASINPWSVFGAKYTAIFAPGATDAATSISNITSPSALLAFDGLFFPPSTRTAVIEGAASLRVL